MTVNEPMGHHIMKKIAFFASVITAGIIASPATAATNLVTNGGFESTTMTRSQQLNTGSDSGVSGWTNATSGNFTGMGYNFLIKSGIAADSTTGGFYSSKGNHDYVFGPQGGNVSAPGYDCSNFGCNNYAANGFTTSPTGGNYLLLDADTTFHGAVSQTISGLVVGQSYTLTFDWAGASWATQPGTTTHIMDVTFGNTTQSTGQLTVDPKGFSGWKSATMTFVAGSTSQTLSFLAQGTPNGLPPTNLLDNVSLTAAVPEPATWAMMLVGFGMVGAASRYRRRKVAIAA